MFVLADADDAFVLRVAPDDDDGTPTPATSFTSLDYYPAGEWSGALAAMEAEGTSPSLVFVLHGRVAWHGLLSMGGSEKARAFAAALETGVFSAAPADTADHWLQMCVAAFDGPPSIRLEQNDFEF